MTVGFTVTEVPVTAPTPLIETAGVGVPETLHVSTEEDPGDTDVGFAVKEETTGAVEVGAGGGGGGGGDAPFPALNAATME